MSDLPNEHTLLCELGLPPLCAASASTLRRARLFLFGVRVPARQAAVLLAGYTAEIHGDGVFRTSLLSGERPFWEWREWRALRPLVDPDLPELVSELDAFVDQWLPHAVTAARSIPGEGERAEILSYFEDGRAFPSRTWRAKARVQRLESLKDDPTAFGQSVWRALETGGFEAEVGRFHAALGLVQEFIRRAPLTAAEVEEMHGSREAAAASVREWLDARRAQLAALGEEELAVLGLGTIEPPPGFDPPIARLAGLHPVAKA